MLGLFKKRSRTTITGINIKLQGHPHQLPGRESNEDTIELVLPFKNKVHSDMLTEAKVFKATKGKPILITAIKVSEPFSLASVTPNVPLSVESGTEVEFKVSIGVPKHNFTGPLNVSFETETEEVIHIEISKTILVWKGKRVEIESSARMLNLQKNGILVEKVQMMKALSFGDTISGATAEFPFKIVGADPKLPVRIDTPNGYIMAFYVQAPPHSYSGELIINVN